MATKRDQGIADQPQCIADHNQSLLALAKRTVVPMVKVSPPQTRRDSFGELCRVLHPGGGCILIEPCSEIGCTAICILTNISIPPLDVAYSANQCANQLETEMNVVASYFAQRRDRDPRLCVSSFFALTNWITVAPMQAFSIFAVIALLIASGSGFRVIAGFMEHGWPNTTTTVAASVAAISAILALFAGLTLRVLGYNDRRRDIAQFLNAKREWNSKLDATEL